MRVCIPSNRVQVVTSKLENLIRIVGKRKMSHTQLPDIDTPIVALSEVNRFISDCLQAVGSPKKHADAMGDLLVEADYRGHYSHGMNRLDMYVNDLKSGTCDGKATPKILKETAATAWVDGQNGLGAVIGNFCMDLALRKAREVGIGWVTAKGSNHFGIAGMYTMQASKESMLGMAFTNTSPFLAPTRSKEAALGTNPLSLAAPGKEGDDFVLDMATSAVAVGKIEIAKRKGQSIPDGWAQDNNGRPTTDTRTALQAACLMPLGGNEINSGYKGYGLGFLVEIFCGILGGARYGPNVRKWGNTNVPADLGQCFVAIDPHCFAPGFEERLSSLMGHMRNMEPTDPSKPVLVAGDPERQHMAAVDRAGGVRYVRNQLECCKKLAEELKVKPLKSLK